MFVFWVLNTIFNNISLTSWQSVLLLEEKVHGENNQPVSDKLYQTQLYLVHVTMDGNKTYISQIGGGLRL